MEENTAYQERNACVAAMAHMALLMGWKVGIRPHEPESDDWEDDWRNVVLIDLPTGQVSWHYHNNDHVIFGHLPRYDGGWDGHTTEEKYSRLREFLNS